MNNLDKVNFTYMKLLQQTCRFHVGSSECNREEGCVCRKLAEIKSLIYCIISPAYRNATFASFTGKLPDGTRAKPFVKNPNRIREVKESLWEYLYGDAPKSIKTREEYNRISILGKRFKEGASVVIHGKTDYTEGTKRIKHEPTGKTLIASIIMLDAIYRKKYTEGKNWTFDKVSFLELRQALKQRDNRIYDLQEVDWLMIDDLVVIDRNPNATTRSDAWTKEAFDAFLIDRMQNNKPTILVCNFDLNSISVEYAMGLAFQKIISDPNTHEIKV